MAAGIKFLEQKLKDAGTLQNAVNVLLKWYEGNDIVFFRTFVEQLPVYLQSSVIPNGGATGQALVKLSDEDGDYTWADVNPSNNLDLATYDPANISQQVVGTTATQTLTNKTLEDYSNHIHADVLHARAKATENILKGQAVVITGYNAGQAAEEVALANNATGVASGIAYENITTGSFGLIITAGILKNVDTSGFDEGDILYVNGSGELTATEPTTGFSQPIAYVLRSNANNGAIQVLASYPKQDAADVRFTPYKTITDTKVQDAIESVFDSIWGEYKSSIEAIDFTKNLTFGTTASPITENITLNVDTLTAKPHASVVVYHAATTEPTISITGVTLETISGAYIETDPATINRMLFTYMGNGYATLTYLQAVDLSKLDGIEDGAEVNTINSVTTGEPSGSDTVLNVVSLTSAEYAAGTPVATTLYLITDA